MRMEDMIMVSVDDHVVEPPDLFENHLSEEYKSKAPKIERLDSGCDVWNFNGQKLPNIGLNAVVGRIPEEYGSIRRNRSDRQRARRLPIRQSGHGEIGRRTGSLRSAQAFRREARAAHVSDR